MSNPAPSLKTLAENKTEGVSKVTTFRVDPNLIQFEEGFNLRGEGEEKDLHVDRLYAAWKAGAQIPAIDVMVRDGIIYARTGHCRTEAAIRLKKEIPDLTIECRQFRGNDADAVLHMIGSDTGSKPLTPLEQGIGFLRLIKFGLTPAKIAERLGVSRVTVDNNIALAEAPAEVHEMVKRGEVSSTTAREAVKAGPEGVKALKEAVESERKQQADSAPGTGTNGNGQKPKAKKKKKVTAKKLRGTAADKKTRGAVATKETVADLQAKVADLQKQASAAAITPDPAPSDPALIMVTVNRDVAQATLDFLRSAGGEYADLVSMAATLETALL